MTTSEQHDVIVAFRRHVNMTESEIAEWLHTPEARAAGLGDGSYTPEDGPVAQRVITLLGKRDEQYDDEEVAFMRETVDAIDQLLQRRPPQDEPVSEWRYQLMNRGHDPLRE